MDRPKWLEARRRGIGGSDVAAIMGLSPFKTAFRVYQEKRKEVDDWGGNALTDWGSRMEPAIRQWYSDTTGRAVRLPDKIIFNEKYPYMLASLDGFTDDPRGVEIKTARSGRDWGEPGTDQIPDYYLVQVQHYMIVTGFPVFDVPVSIGGGAPELYEVPADKELQEMIIEAEARFWEQVQNGNPPDVTTYADAVARFGKNATSGAVIASAAAILDVVNLHQVREEMKALEEREEFLKGNLITFIGESGDTIINESGETLVTYKLSNGRRTFDSKAFQKDNPDLYQKYVRTGEQARRFLIK